MTKEKLSKKNWFLITLFCFVGGVAWNTENMYFNTFLFNSAYAAATYPNEFGVETVVPSKNMFFVAGTVCLLVLIPMFFLIRKGLSADNKSDRESSETKASVSGEEI